MKTVPVLQLSEANREAMKRHFLALEAEDLRLRFEHVICEATLLKYVDAIDFGRGIEDGRADGPVVGHVPTPAATGAPGLAVVDRDQQLGPVAADGGNHRQREPRARCGPW